MSTNIITFPGSYAATNPATSLKDRKPEPRIEASTKRLQTSDSSTSMDRRRKKDDKSRRVEPNIQEICGENGKLSYRVQIRKFVSGRSISFTKTFSKLAMAKKWKKRKLAEIEIDGVEGLC